MSFSNAIAWFIILTTGATLPAAGLRDLRTAEQAAEALRPLAVARRDCCSRSGIAGAGARRRRGGGVVGGMDERPLHAGVAAVLNGGLAPPLLVLILVMCNDAEVMGPHRNGRSLNLLGGATAVLMAGAVVAMLPSGM